MADNKKSFVLYCDLVHVIRKLIEQDRKENTNYSGELFLHILEYVNDENPFPINFIVDMAFEPIKQQLKRDLKRYEVKQTQRIEAGRRSAEQRKVNEELRNSTTVNDRSVSSTVNGNVNVNGNGNVNDNVNVILNKDIGDEIIIPKKTWKNDFEIYKENVRNGYREIMEDEAWFKKQSEFYPNVNILKSIEKSCVNFWITEAGWKNKKKTKTETINWKLTFANAISQPQNKVYYDRNSDPKQTGDNKNRIYSGGNNAEQRRASVENLTSLAEAILQQS